MELSDYGVVNVVLSDAGLYPAAVALALAHQLPVDLVEKVKLTLPFDDVVPLPVATGVPPHVLLAYTPSDTLAPLMGDVETLSVTLTDRGTL